MPRKPKFKVNDRVNSLTWELKNPFYVVQIIDDKRVVIENDKVRAIVSEVDLTLIRE